MKINNFQIEPVKERKKIWEQKASVSSSYIDRRQEENNLNSTKKKVLTNREQLPRKWSSLVSINDENLNNNVNISKISSRKNSIESINGGFVVIQAANSLSNINLCNTKDSNTNSNNSITIQNHNIEITQLPAARPVLVEIVTYENDTHRKPDNLCLDETHDIVKPIQNTANDSNIVQKLKQKFDHKDQSFIKVASLTCRNVFKDGFKSQSRQNNLNNIRPMLSLYEPSGCESLQKIGK